jgi:membrane protease YdiL (CAAX protease family)
MKSRPFVALFMLIGIPPLIGALLAPQVNAHLIPALHRAWPQVEPFNAPEFQRVMDRCVMAVAICLLFPAFRMSGLAPRIRDALRISRSRGSTLASAIAIGMASMSAAYVLGWMLGGYRVSDDVPSVAAFFGRGALFLAGSVFVGLFEEIFFRGFFFGAMRSRFGFWGAAVPAAVFFMALHFLRPTLPAGFDASRWYAGFAVMPELIRGFDAERDTAFAITLFLMGLALCRFYERDGHLWRAIGLHGGWVWAMQLGAFALDRNYAIMSGVLGPSDYVAQGPAAIPIIGVFLAWSFRRGRGD